MNLRCLICNEERKSPKGLFFHVLASHRNMFNSRIEASEKSYSMVSKCMNLVNTKNMRNKSLSVSDNVEVKNLLKNIHCVEI